MFDKEFLTVFQSSEPANTHFLDVFLFRIWIKAGNSFKLEIYALFVGVRQTKLCLKTILYLAVIHHQARGEAGPLRAGGTGCSTLMAYNNPRGNKFVCDVFKFPKHIAQIFVRLM